MLWVAEELVLKIFCNFLKMYGLLQAAIKILGNTFKLPVGKSDQLILTIILCINEVIVIMFIDNPIQQLNNGVLSGNGPNLCFRLKASSGDKIKKLT